MGQRLADRAVTISSQKSPAEAARLETEYDSETLNDLAANGGTR